MNTYSRALTSVAAAITIAGAAIIANPVAASASYLGCDYPRVCFYLHYSDLTAQRPTASFRDAGYWQNLGSRSYGANFVYNSRNDDGALLHFTNGNTYCVEPLNGTNLPNYYGIADRIKIMDSPTC
jgi:hypothetical protein